MDVLLMVLMLGVVVQVLNAREAGARIALLGGHLTRFQIERLMVELTDGYLVALGMNNPEQRNEYWQALDRAEQTLGEQVTRFAAEFAQVDADEARVSQLPVTLPRLGVVFPQWSFDFRELLSIHAKGITAVIANAKGLNQRDKAYMLTAELYLFKHSCHWFCRSKTVASARLFLQHQTAYEQVLEAISPETRKSYLALVG